jgi:hypothetical protein
LSAAAIPVNENRPAPIIAPTPRATRDLADNVLFRPFRLLKLHLVKPSGFVSKLTYIYWFNCYKWSNVLLYYKNKNNYKFKIENKFETLLDIFYIV